MMKKTKYSLVLAFFLIAALLLALTWQGAENGEGKNKHASLSKPQRIISMSPGHTEILFALGAGDRVVGVTSYSNYPEEAKSKTEIGDYLAPDMEKIISLVPDIVFALSQTQAQYLGVLEEAGIHVVAIEPKSMGEILAAIDTIARAVGEEEKGAELYSELSRELEQIRSSIASLTPKKVFVEVWGEPLLTIGKKSFISDIISQAGGVNVAAEKNLAYASCDIETLYAYNPEVYIIISHDRGNVSSFITKHEFTDIKAVKNKQVYSVLADVLVRSGPRSFAGLAEVAKIIHPEAF